MLEITKVSVVAMRPSSEMNVSIDCKDEDVVKVREDGRFPLKMARVSER